MTEFLHLKQIRKFYFVFETKKSQITDHTRKKKKEKKEIIAQHNETK
jgi:hypothetical protein